MDKKVITLRAIKKPSYHDNVLNRSVMAGEVFECDEKRALDLLSNPNNLVELLSIIKLKGKDKNDKPLEKGADGLGDSTT